MTTSRQKVLSYLSKTRSASAREIARALKMAPAAIRHHLRVLLSDGRVERTSVRGRDARGRPENLYALPRAALGDNLAALSDALLAEAGTRLGTQSLAKRLRGESGAAGQPLARQLSLAVETLNGMSYHAHWEAGPHGPRMVLGHCPYAAIIEKHPELCRMDEALLRELLGQPAAQILKAGKEGSSVCVFAVGR